jgi:hypothetical protein
MINYNFISALILKIYYKVSDVMMDDKTNMYLEINNNMKVHFYIQFLTFRTYKIDYKQTKNI